MILALEHVTTIVMKHVRPNEAEDRDHVEPFEGEKNGQNQLAKKLKVSNDR